MRSLLTALLVLSAAAPAAAQPAAPYSWDGPAQSDVAWEERRESYGGQPLRPGSQIEYSASPLVPVGAVMFGVGFAIGVGGAIAGRPEAAIPLAGPWLAAADVFARGGWDDIAAVAMGVAGAVQLVGLGLLIVGIAIPDRYVIYDAPVGAPSPYAIRLTPSAGPGTVGLTLSVEAL